MILMFNLKQSNFIFGLFLRTILTLTFLMLSMNVQASSKSHEYEQAVESGHQEFISGAEEDSRHGEEVNHWEKVEPHFEKDKGSETMGLEGYVRHEEEVHHGENLGEHFGKDTVYEPSHEGKGHIDKDHQAEVPLAYLFYWGILILVMVIILIYFVYRRKNKGAKPIIPLAVFLVLFALSIYIIEIITPAFAGRLDMKALKIVYEFHESPNLGFLRFIYKFALGIFMTLFAFLNMNRKKFEQKSMEEQG